MVPSTMKVLELGAYGGAVRVVERPVPVPGRGEVLVRMAAAPVNPSDLKFIRGVYGLRKPLPVVPGFEGSGTVVAAGGGLRAKVTNGRRVGCLAPDSGDGTWAEYMLAEAAKCIPLRKNVTLEQGAMMVVNPWTAWALLETARRGGHRAAVHTAAAGALGQMMARLARRLGFPMVHVVRSERRFETLRAQGAEHVLRTDAPDFDARLKDLCERLGATIVFDPVAGEMTGRALAAMPHGSRAVVYGTLSRKPCAVPPELLLYENKRVEGFWLARWVRGRSLLGRMRIAVGVQKRLGTDFRTSVRARVPLEGAAEAIAEYERDPGGGKVLIVPGTAEPPGR